MWAHSSQRISSSKGQTMCSWRELNFERNKIYPKFARFKKIDNLGNPDTDVLVMAQSLKEKIFNRRFSILFNIHQINTHV